MKKILLSLFVMGGALFALAGENPNPTPKEINGVVVFSKSTRPKSRHSPVNADLILIIEENLITVLTNEDHGIGTFQLIDSDTSMIYNGEIDSSVENSCSILYNVTDSSFLNFNILFEDGSWCQLSWNGEV